ncbi:hypothetical protein LK994_09495 [Ferruginibacter lapsinanis]|uniref:hypothetical protein n=1 Tax=Ferruginibacter lapsinanis TaxID=563172 RepID=UPI001E4A1576|nr:hypothetical protein [Ferruginibacter lapsinanis]UEG48870.1 hypothetical protein LK994_09495 [Ferruginibacter lapsinanis]
MKKLLVVFTLILTSFIFKANAQVNVSFNVGAQPVWGPVGYDYAEYYYLPDVDAYYYVPQRQFIYKQGKKWVFSPTLPPKYRGYDLYHGYKVVINDPRPYDHHDIYYVKYAPYKGKKGQMIIRDSHDERYWVIKGHPDHGKWKAAKYPGKGPGKGPWKGKGHGKH